MILKILSKNGSVSGALKYNNDKIAENNCSILSTKNVYGNSIKEYSAIIKCWDNSCHNTKRTNMRPFHLAVCPDGHEMDTEETVIKYIDRLMLEMGYDQQPYIVYKHTDIARTHYHIVSTRVDKNGKLIPNHHDRYNLMRIGKSLEEEFGYKMGINSEARNCKVIGGDEEEPFSFIEEEDYMPQLEAQEREAEERRRTQKNVRILSEEYSEPEEEDLSLADIAPELYEIEKGGLTKRNWTEELKKDIRYTPKRLGTKKQIMMLTAKALSYHVNNAYELNYLLLSMGIKMTDDPKRPGKHRFQALDYKGRPCTAPMKVDDELEDIVSSTLEEIKTPLPKDEFLKQIAQQKKMYRLIRSLYYECKSFDEFRAELYHFNMEATPHFANGELCDIILTDHKYRNVFHLSETGIKQNGIKRRWDRIVKDYSRMNAVNTRDAQKIEKQKNDLIKMKDSIDSVLSRLLMETNNGEDRQGYDLEEKYINRLRR